jgi:hypothetical protein
MNETLGRIPISKELMMRFYNQAYKFYCGIDLHARLFVGIGYLRLRKKHEMLGRYILVPKFENFLAQNRCNARAG